jgi:hypothetical protein
VVTLALGVIIITAALQMSQLRQLDLFLKMQRVRRPASALPITVPLDAGAGRAGARRRGRAGARCWSGSSGSLLIDRLLARLGPPARSARPPPLDAAAREYWRQGVQLHGQRGAGPRAGLPVHHARLEMLAPGPPRRRWRSSSARLERADRLRGGGGRRRRPTTARQSWRRRLAGALAYGTFAVLLSLIPNPWSGRLAFAGLAAGVVAVIGALLVRSGRATAKAPAAP